MIGIVIALFLCFFFIGKKKEGMTEDNIEKAYRSMKTAMKDRRMDSSQIMALENALQYTKFIKEL